MPTTETRAPVEAPLHPADRRFPGVHRPIVDYLRAQAHDREQHGDVCGCGARALRDAADAIAAGRV